VFPLLPNHAKRPLVLYGSGAERFAGRWPIEAVDVRGWAPDLLKVFATARCFVAPLTFGAGTKGKILEAAAASVPVVTTSVGAEGYSGALLDSLFVTDDPDTFAKYVEVLMTDDEAWARARDAALEGALEWELRAGIEQAEWASWVRRRQRLGIS
jgi:glycosyltransferase involved in cell wall biosynthesis